MKAIEPLHALLEFPDRYEIVLDMPMAKEETITVLMKKKYVVVRAKLKEEAREVLSEEVEEYLKVIKMPEDVEERMSTKVIKRESVMLFIIIPRI